MKKASIPQTLSFQSKLVRIAPKTEYFALSVPLKISQALQTRGPVPVMARVNGSSPFLISLFPVGGGRHYLRVKAAVRNEVKIKEGERVRVQITVRDRSDDAAIPKDLLEALKAEGVLKDFEALPIGQRGFIIRKIDEAAKPETRAKRIQAAVEAAHQKREQRIDRRK
jgi:hypothetical protein